MIVGVQLDRNIREKTNI